MQVFSVQGLILRYREHKANSLHGLIKAPVIQGKMVNGTELTLV